jgi:lipopolysaccharide export system protein LptA
LFKLNLNKPKIKFWNERCLDTKTIEIPLQPMLTKIKQLFLFILLVISINSDAIAQTSIELIGADVSEYDASYVDAERLIGNVKFKQGNVYMGCDSAWFYHGENKVEAFGSIYIRQVDTLDLWGDYLLYNGDTKQALVKNNVRMTDKEMTLKTNLIQYDLTNKIAYYTSGGNIENGQDRLYSRKGHYYSRSKDFHFKDSVRLWNPQYTMESDTLWYNTFTKIATFWGPTYIHSDENTIFCKYGWYNTKLNTSQFSKGAWIAGKENKLWADSMLYNRNTGVGRAFRNILLIDTIEKVSIAGNYGTYKRLEKSTWISGNPIAMKVLEDDTLFIMADTLMDKTDTASNKREMLAYHHTKIYKIDMQGVADSLKYSFSDSLIALYKNPILWNDASQITGDTLFIYRKNNRLDRMDVRQKAFIIMEDTLNKYNQIKGRNMTAWFEQNKLSHVNVYGNGQSVYYAKEDDGNYSGVNEVSCSDMLIKIDSNKVTKITFYNQPEGTFYPLEEFPEENSLLPDFKWLEALKPNATLFYENKIRLQPKK